MTLKLRHGEVGFRCTGSFCVLVNIIVFSYLFRKQKSSLLSLFVTVVSIFSRRKAIKSKSKSSKSHPASRKSKVAEGGRGGGGGGGGGQGRRLIEMEGSQAGGVLLIAFVLFISCIFLIQYSLCHNMGTFCKMWKQK